MDGWVDEGADSLTDGRMRRWKDVRTNSRNEKFAFSWADRCTDKHTDSRAARQMGWLTNKQGYRQAKSRRDKRKSRQTDIPTSKCANKGRDTETVRETGLQIYLLSKNMILSFLPGFRHFIILTYFISNEANTPLSLRHLFVRGDFKLFPCILELVSCFYFSNTAQMVLIGLESRFNLHSTNYFSLITWWAIESY